MVRRVTTSEPEFRRRVRRATAAFLLAALAIAALIPRAAHAQATWASATSGTWGVADNWSTGIVPGNGNTTAAVLSNTSASYTVTYDGGNANTMTSLTASNAAGRLTTIDVNSTGFNFGTSTLTNARINVNSGGSMTTSGTVTASGSANIVVQGGTFTSGGNLGNNGTVNLTLTSGSIAATSGFFFPVLTMSGGNIRVTGGISGINGGTISGGTYTDTNSTVVMNVRSGQLTLTGSGQIVTAGFTVPGNTQTMQVSSGSFTVTGNAFLVGSNTFTLTRTGYFNQSGGSVTSTNAAGLIVGNASGALAAGSDYAYVLSGGTFTVEKITLAASGYIGAGTNRFTMSGGMLNLGSGGIVIGSGSGTKLVQLSGGTIAAKADWSSSVAMSLLTSAGTGTATFKAADSSDVARSITLSGVLSGSGALAKTGGGVLTLSNVNTYLGATRISGGRVLLSGSGSINSSSGIALDGGELKTNSSTAIDRTISFGAAGGTISGTGSIASLVTAGTGAVLSPGNSPGIQEYSAGLVWNPGGTYVWETNALTGTAGTNWDVINVSGGSLNLSGLSDANPFILDLTTLAAGDLAGELFDPYDGGSYTFQIANYASLLLPTGYSSTAGSDLTSLFGFNNLVNWQGAKPAVGDISVKVNSTATGIDLVIVPEPSTIIFAGIGIAMAGWSAWNRRRVLRILKRA